MIVNKTELALISRGIDRACAQRLRKGGWTIGRMARLSVKKLRNLGLRQYQIEAVQSGARPPIPIEFLIAVLFANRFTCCVCRDPEQSIVVHHIKSWAASKNHKPINLAVVCLRCHGKAHTRSELALDLSPKRLQQLKKKWETTVRALDRDAIRSAVRLEYSAWHYFNHLRLLEIAMELGIAMRSLPSYRALVAAGVVDVAGHIRRRPTARYLHSGEFGMHLYAYTKGLMDRVLDMLRITNISDHLDKGTLPLVLKPGDFIYVQGAHVFANAPFRRPSVESVVGRRRANGVEVKFSFDRREATSNSAYSMWLRGRQDVGSLVQVKRIQAVNRSLTLDGSVLGICAALNGLKQRPYDMKLWMSGLMHRIESDFDFEPIPERP